MFSRGLESLLRENAQLDIVGQETDINHAFERIAELRPDVVILNGDQPDLEVAHILKVSPDIKVIGLSLENNNLYIYRASQRVTRSVSDLLEAIEQNLSSEID
jgi:DNA-binding NarL/FixJ family response regulator